MAGKKFSDMEKGERWDNLDARVRDYRNMELPGQTGYHMGTSYLVNDLWAELNRVGKP